MIFPRIANMYPAISYVLLLMLTLLPIHLLHMDNMVLMINAIPVFFWSLYRPNVMPYWFVFLIGGVYDIIAGLPLSLHALTNILIRNRVSAGRERYLKVAFSAVWLKFVIVTAIISLLQWMIISSIYGEFFSLGRLFIQWFLTALSYPLFHNLFYRLYIRMPREPVERKIL